MFGTPSLLMWSNLNPLVMRYKMIFNFESVDKILKCGHSMKVTEHYFLVVLFIFRYFAKENLPLFVAMNLNPPADVKNNCCGFLKSV